MASTLARRALSSMRRVTTLAATAQKLRMMNNSSTEDPSRFECDEIRLCVASNILPAVTIVDRQSPDEIGAVTHIVNVAQRTDVCHAGLDDVHPLSSCA
eukprot:CAMPEP_0197404790 /NCGR_PEP_ID=MMETSP1165-20131217/23451_1 /TAXON_ID=284809 /ORGANISM="Chrysocystis fragilis, Strain CCMP3189" /LENGTH=98 /DNA_ID=CAMNT_0042931075 /DNA_START=23 /DNA_END=318 /DNA_ORIENTATION=+